MASLAPDVQVQTATVTHQRAVGDDSFVMAVKLPQALPNLGAGKFFMLRRPDGLSPEIPRPFSVYRQTAPDTLEFLVKVHGRGTQALGQTQPGEPLSVIGPLGLGWPPWNQTSGNKWFLAGGIGSAPFYMGIQQALDQGVAAEDMTMIYGGRSSGFLYDLDLFEALGVRVIPATDDGSEGFHGNVVQAAEDLLAREGDPGKVEVFTCGPDPMMKAVVAFAKQHHFESWVSLETYMGCGVGICNGCAVGTVPGGSLDSWPVVKSCLDGPVFRAADIDF